MVNLSISITPFKLADLRAILRLEQEVFPEDTYGMAEFLTLYLRGKDAFLVARQGQQVVGYAAGYIEDEIGYIASIAVHPTSQRHGIGRALMEAVMKRLIETGARRLGLHVREDNAAAIHLYEQIGFVTHHLIPDYYEDGAPALYMERSLTDFPM